jgi:hypothetical protein
LSFLFIFGGNRNKKTANGAIAYLLPKGGATSAAQQILNDVETPWWGRRGGREFGGCPSG